MPDFIIPYPPITAYERIKIRLRNAFVGAVSALGWLRLGGSGDPEAELDLVNVANGSSAAVRVQAGESAWRVEVDDAAGQISLEDEPTGSVPFKLANGAATNALVITQGGGIVLGGAAPAVGNLGQLEIQSTDPSLIMKETDAPQDQKYVQFLASPVSGNRVFAIRALTDAGAETFRFVSMNLATGRIGIRVNDPSEALEVNGNVKSFGALLSSGIDVTGGGDIGGDLSVGGKLTVNGASIQAQGDLVGAGLSVSGDGDVGGDLSVTGSLSLDGAFIEQKGPTSNWRVNIQDGSGRVNLVWNSNGGPSPTYATGGEDALRILCSTGGQFRIYWASGSGKSAGDAVVWEELLAVTATSVTYKGSSLLPPTLPSEYCDLSAPQASINGGWQNVTFSQEDDPYGMHGTGSNTHLVTIPTSGRYTLTGHIELSGTGFPMSARLRRVVGGVDSTITSQDIHPTTPTPGVFTVSVSIGWTLRLSAGDIVYLQANHSAATRTVVTAALSITRVQ